MTVTRIGSKSERAKPRQTDITHPYPEPELPDVGPTEPVAEGQHPPATPPAGAPKGAAGRENPLVAAGALAKRLDALATEKTRAEADPAAFVASHFDAERITKLANASAEAVELLVLQSQVEIADAGRAAAVRKGRVK